MRRRTCGPERSPSNLYLNDGESVMNSIDMLTHSGDMKVEKMKREDGSWLRRVREGNRRESLH